MRLELGLIHIKDVRFAAMSAIEDRVLSINRAELVAVRVPQQLPTLRCSLCNTLPMSEVSFHSVQIGIYLAGGL